MKYIKEEVGLKEGKRGGGGGGGLIHFLSLNSGAYKREGLTLER